MGNEQVSGIIYLACPYTHPSAVVRLQRFELATRAAAKLIAQGLIVFSPITMTHPIDVQLAGTADTLGSEFWVSFDESFMNFCSEMAILRVNGWENSPGVARERKYFESRGRKVWFIDP
jgi:hypothetical protein